MPQFPTLIYESFNNKSVERLKPEQIKGLQNKRFRSLLHHVWNHSPYYRELYEKNGLQEIDLDHVQSLDLPIDDKEILQENFDEVICDRRVKKSDRETIQFDPTYLKKRYLGKYHIVHTSGTSGRQSFYLYSFYDRARIPAIVQTHFIKTPIRLNRVKIFSVPVGNFDMGASLSNNAFKYKYHRTVMSLENSFENIVEKMNAVKPDYLIGNASFLFHLAKHADDLKLK